MDFLLTSNFWEYYFKILFTAYLFVIIFKLITLMVPKYKIKLWSYKTPKEWLTYFFVTATVCFIIVFIDKLLF